MSIDLKVVGAHELHSLARRLREEGHIGLKTEMRRTLSKADRPLEVAVRAGVGEYLPTRYARILAKATKVTTRLKTTGSDVSVRLQVGAKGKVYPRHIAKYDNPGILRHPVFGRTRPLKNHAKLKAVTYTNPWVAQNVRPGFVSDHFDALRGQLRRDLIQAMHHIAEKITKG